VRKGLFGGGGSRVDEDDGLSAVAGPGNLYAESDRGRTDNRKGEKGGRDASRSRSRSSSVLRKIMGRKDKPKSMEVKPPATSIVVSTTRSLSGDTFRDDVSVVSANTTGTGNFRKERIKIKKISKKSKDGPLDSRRSNHSIDENDNFRGFGVEEEEAPLSPSLKVKKIKKKSQSKYKTHKDGMDSDGDYGMESEGDEGRSMDGRSVNSDGVLSPAARQIRRKKKPKKDDDTCDSSKSSLNGDASECKGRSSGSRARRKVESIAEPMSPAGKVLMSEMDDLYPSPKSSDKKKSRSSSRPRRSPSRPRRSPTRSSTRDKPDIAVITFQKDEVKDGHHEISPDKSHRSRKLNRSNSNENFQKIRSSWEMQQVASPSQNRPVDVTPHPQRSSSRSPRVRSVDDDVVMSLTDTVTSLNNQLDGQREEGKELQRQLAEALASIASMNELIRREEAVSRKANAYLSEVREELGKVMDEKADMAKIVNNLEDDLRAKDERIEKIQQVVETQLDTVEFLEDKLEKTEDELFKLEDEFKALEDEGLLNQSRDRIGRMDSIRVDRLKRKDSIILEKQESRRLLCSNDDDDTDHTRSDHGGKRTRSSSIEKDIEERERKLVAREKELTVQSEEYDLREQRLEEWEQELLELDEQLKHGNDSSTKERLLERRERKLEETREELEQKKEEWTKKINQLEEENRKLQSSQGSGELDQQIKALRNTIEKLDDEKADLEDSLERVNRMLEEANGKVSKLQIDNDDLRGKLGDDDSRQKEIRKLQAEISTLRKGAGGGGTRGQDELVRQMQEEIAEQLTELDDENQKLTDKLLSESNRFEGQLKLKDETIEHLERRLEGLEKNLGSQDSGAYIASLLKEISELKGKNKVFSSMDSELNDALDVLEKKEAKIKSLEEKLVKLEGQGQTSSNRSNEEDYDDGKDLLIRELQNQLVAAKKDLQTYSTGDYVTRLKLEVKNLKIGYNDLKKRLKKEENDARALIKKKDESIQSMQKEIAGQKREIERREKREKNLGTDQKLPDGDLEKHIEDLEDEIDHWKATNADLEHELDTLKVEVSELKSKVEGSEDLDDDCSVGSIQSFTSQMSEQQQGMEKSNHSITSLRSNDLFFVSNSDSVRGHRTVPTSEEPSTPSQRALRTVSDLWSKMRSGPDLPAHSNNPAIPYGIGSLDDD
jgi:DNA repair exonuclease SbcCD ATPase subunit